jgi:hypothetical protein
VKVFAQLHIILGELIELRQTEWGPQPELRTGGQVRNRAKARSKNFKLEVVGGTQSAPPH